MRSSTWTPFFLKMSALSASDSGEKPVHPLMPSTTFCACAAGSAAASDAATKKTANGLIATPGKDLFYPHANCRGPARNATLGQELAHGGAPAHPEKHPGPGGGGPP